jgi:hypothetical protein
VCAAAAVSAGLPGTFIAYASSSTEDAVDRLSVARGWVRTDGKPFADAAIDVASGNVFYPPRVDEHGQPVDNSHYGMTGTTVGRHADTCLDFTTNASTEIGTVGSAWLTFDFSSSTPDYCNLAWSLYCFEIDRTAVVHPALATVRHAFVSSAWFPGLGIADADARCQGDAAAVSLGGSYRALLATATASAASRFDLAGPPWARVDGAILAPTADAVMQLQLETPLDLDVMGHRAGTLYFGTIWTGASTPTTIGLAGETCNSWSDSTNTFFGTTGGTWALDGSFFSENATSCNASQQLYCLQQ